MKAITTQYVPATSRRQPHIRAFDMDGNKVTIRIPDENDDEKKYRAAANALCQKMDWYGRLVGGAINNGYVFVFVD